ncbi:MAG TPA: UDP-N-acetylmuramoyl-tripeptide--D-alanyl-D-alanine ligase [Pseudomonadales bacterium]|nr:UDP-N-acetylmuramoyl-tripeptide--D-alanyl-D-alanine ligase [Pseudomonadales bacterium]
MLLSQMARAISAEFYGQDQAIRGFSTDTRSLKKGDVFVALRGEHFDGHAYLSEAIAKECMAVVVDHFQPDLSVSQWVVADTRLALGHMAEVWRLQFNALKVIAVTGSCGKTTVKDMLAAICQQVAPTLATVGNLNNDIGVPLTLLQLTEEHRFAVIEIGTNAPGEIAYSAKLAHPDVALITNAAAVHLEGLGSVDNVAKEKGDIYRALSSEGIAVINLDDAHGEYWNHEVQAMKKHVVLCAKKSENQQAIFPDFCLENVTQAEQGMYQFDIVSASSRVSIEASLPGEHNVTNALLAAAAAKSVNIDDACIKAGLENVKSAPGRLNRYALPERGWLLIDDSYNANPHSVKAAIDLLAQFKNGQTVLVLGDMAELGDDVRHYHREVGQWAKNKGIDYVFAVGRCAADVAEGFGETTQIFSEHAALIKVLPHLLKADMTILVKGSRSAKMEVIVQAIRNLERGSN